MHCKYIIALLLLFLNYRAFSLPVIFTTNESNLHFYYQDSLGYGHPVNIKKGLTTVYINAPVLLFEADKNQTPYLIYPGDKIIISKDPDEFSVFTIENQIERTNELLFFNVLIRQSGGIYMTFPFHQYQGKAADAAQLHNFEKKINEIKIFRLFLLDSFSKKHTISSDFQKTVKGILLSTAIKDSILLYQNNSDYLKNEGLYDKVFSNLMSTINTMEFSPLMPYLLTCLMPVSINKNNMLEFAIDNKADFINAINFTEKNYSGMAKSFLYARIFYTALKNNIPISKENMKQFYDRCTDENYTRQVKEKMADKKLTGISNPGDKVLLSDKTFSDLNSIIKNNTGKLIYLDFWASWCSPCRAEMAASALLKKKYEKQEIVFIYVSIDKNISDWIRASKEENLQKQENFLLANPDSSPFVKLHKIQTIPRYFLISKSGKIINDYAPRPGDPKLKILIEEYLNKQ